MRNILKDSGKNAKKDYRKTGENRGKTIRKSPVTARKDCIFHPFCNVKSFQVCIAFLAAGLAPFLAPKKQIECFIVIENAR